MTGSQIRKARSTKGWTQAELAERLGCGQSTLSMIESDQLRASPDIIKRIARIFDTVSTTKKVPGCMTTNISHEKCHHGVVWHPNVQHYYGEGLYYLLIKFARYAPWIPDDGVNPMSPLEVIHTLLEKVGAYGHCIYEVFGDMDLLVRVWLDTDRYKLLKDRLARSRQIMDTQAFACDTEDYLWAIPQGRWRDVTDHEIAASSKEIESCSKQLSLGKPWQDIDNAVSLSEEGFILKFLDDGALATLNAKDNTSIKFFTFLEISPRSLSASHIGRHTTNQVINSVRAICEQEEYGISDVSVYLGTSRRLGNCLLKGTVKTSDYYRVYQLIVEGLSVLDQEASPHTYLSAAGTWHESDDLAPDPLAANREAKAILAFVGVRLDEVSDLDLGDPKSKALIAAYDAVSPLFTIDDESLLEQFVRGLLQEDQKAVRMGSSFLFEIERYMVEYFRFRIAESNSDKNFTKFVAQKIGELKLDAQEAEKDSKNIYCPPSSLAKFTLKDYEVFLAKFCPAREIAAELGADWQRNVVSTIEIRNKMAHGRFGDLIAKWADHMKEIAPAMCIYYRLRRWHLARDRQENKEE